MVYYIIFLMKFLGGNPDNNVDITITTNITSFVNFLVSVYIIHYEYLVIPSFINITNGYVVVFYLFYLQL